MDDQQKNIWQKIDFCILKNKDLKIGALFSQDHLRVKKYCAICEDLFLDYSKSLLDDKLRELLIDLANEKNLKNAIAALLSGEHVNTIEDQPALHTALRSPCNSTLMYQGHDIVKDVHVELDKISEFAENVRSGRYTGHTGKPICDVVHIGIGGSHLGPKMAYDALGSYIDNSINFHFVSSYSNDQVNKLLSTLDPESTLVIVISKSFGTPETIDNANIFKGWLINKGGDVAVNDQCIAVSANVDKAIAFGVKKENIFAFWPWVGGRYSLWSAGGLGLMIAIGADNFKQLLLGARVMDEHFASQPLELNMPVILGLLDVLYINFYDAETIAILPYASELKNLPDYLQQLSMESLGKSVTTDGVNIEHATGAVIWGGVGTNSQHSFHQLLLQGTHFVPIDFILSLGDSDIDNKLVANCFAQSHAMMAGLPEVDILNDLKNSGIDQDTARLLAKHKTIPGNNPSNIIMFEKLTPKVLGQLLALYEHRVYVQSVIWSINAFDQWGVEIGKVVAKKASSKIDQIISSNEYLKLSGVERCSYLAKYLSKSLMED